MFRASTHGILKKKLYTFEIAVEYKINDSGGKCLYVWVAYGLNFHLTQTSLVIIGAWVSTAHSCKGNENYVAQE